MAKASGSKNGLLMAVIGDEDTVTGLLLGGIGNVDGKNSNFLIVKSGTGVNVIRNAFLDFTKRPDIGIVAINQHIANTIRMDIDSYTKMIPTLLEIPSKDHPFNPDKDYIMNKVNKLTSIGD